MKDDSAKILVLNCGSSSIKFEVYAMPDSLSLACGVVERIGASGGSNLSIQIGNQKLLESVDSPDHRAALDTILSALTHPARGLLKSLDEISGVGHRVVHGGEDYHQSVVIDSSVMDSIHKNCELAPLHNPHNLMGIQQIQILLPLVGQVAVFDTAFHQTLPPAAYLYGLPREFYERYRIRRYGFHGTSHRYVSNRAMKLMKRSFVNTNVITCHLGNGASITAIERGRSIDTSMGFTPLEGLIMGTRSGDIDPSILPYLSERGYEVNQLLEILNKKSGLLGLSQISNDLRDLEAAVEQQDRYATEALDAYAHQIRKYIGAYVANLVKTDILVFTGGIGQHGVRMRERICNRLESLGIMMDYEKNRQNGSREGSVSHAYSPVAILVIPTNEELQIARDTYALLSPSTEDSSF